MAHSRAQLHLLLLLATPLAAQTKPRAVHLDIRPDSAAFEPAAAEYRAVWSSEGSRIVAAMERFSGLRFQETRIPVRVVAGPSSSGYREEPMRLRATYPEPTKRATLIHELGHRLQNHLFKRDKDDHPALFLWLYDVWIALYGPDFAREQVEVESARKGGRHDYAGMWATALARDSASRAAAWRELREGRK
jgi:uncharacterized protein (DUF433 family)